MMRRESDRQAAEDIGYVKAMVEANCRRCDRIMAIVKENSEREAEFRKDIVEGLNSVKSEVSAYKMVIKGIKISFAVLLAILTLKFGDIKEILTFKG